MSTNNKKTTGNFKFKKELEKVSGIPEPRELSFTTARRRMEAIRKGGKPEKGDYELGLCEIRDALNMVENNLKQNVVLMGYIAHAGANLCGDRNLPKALIKRIGRIFDIKPGDTPTVEQGTAKVV